MAKKKNDYFELLVNQAEFCVRAAKFLEESLCNFSAEKVNEIHSRMHQIEHSADVLHHDILTRLSTEFITPIDQEDILRLVQIIDDVTDALDEVTHDFYMYGIKELPNGVEAFSKLVSSCVNSLFDAVSELKNFKKPEQLREKIIEMNNSETQADTVYTDSIHALFESDADPKTLISTNKIFDSLENCCDLCEHAADIIEQIIIKNT